MRLNSAWERPTLTKGLVTDRKLSSADELSTVLIEKDLLVKCVRCNLVAQSYCIVLHRERSSRLISVSSLERLLNVASRTGGGDRANTDKQASHFHSYNVH